MSIVISTSSERLARAVGLGLIGFMYPLARDITQYLENYMENQVEHEIDSIRQFRFRA